MHQHIHQYICLFRSTRMYTSTEVYTNLIYLQCSSLGEVLDSSLEMLSQSETQK